MARGLLNNRYLPKVPLGKGGFGFTVIAEDTHMPSRRACVIKQLNPITQDPQFYKFAQERFHREAAILEELGRECEQIPTLYAYFEERGRFYLVQELIEGDTILARVNSSGLFRESEVTDILDNTLKVLEFVHSKNIIHRDIKPENVILRKSDNKPVLIDFGAVKETMLNANEVENQTKVIGTPGYMPIEQGVGRPVFSSDLFSLAMTAIFMLTGRHPKYLKYDPLTGGVQWQELAGSVSVTLAEVLNKAIQSHPRDRYQTAGEMLGAMGDLHLDLLADQLRRFKRPKKL